MEDKLKPNKLRKILLLLLIIFGVVGIIDTIALIPMTSSITLGMVFPGVLGTVLIIFAVINLKKKNKIFKNKMLLRLIIVAFIAASVFFFTIEAFIFAGAHSKEAKDTEANFVIVLGCGIFPDGELTLTLKNRLDAAVEYMERFPNTICVVSGGQGANEPMPEGQAMSEYLITRGIDDSKILREEKSTSTRENLLWSLDIMNTVYPDKEKSAALVSSDFHIFRIKFLAKRYGIDAIGIPTDTPWYIRVNCYIREFFAVMKSFFLD